MTRVVDLSHATVDALGVFPGDPEVKFTPHHQYKNGYMVTSLTMGTHTGTHVDAPIHKFPGAKSVSQMDICGYIGWRTAVLDFTEGPFEVDAEALKKALAPYEGVDGVIIKTGWEKNWGTDAFFEGFPGLNENCAEYLKSIGVHIVGLEAPSVNSSRHESVHESLLSNEIAIVESICNICSLKSPVVEFHAVPLKLEGLDGSPVRAYALER